MPLLNRSIVPIMNTIRLCDLVLCLTAHSSLSPGGCEAVLADGASEYYWRSRRGLNIQLEPGEARTSRRRMEVTITQLADREDSRSNKPCCNTACSAGFYLHTNREDNKMSLFIWLRFTINWMFWSTWGSLRAAWRLATISNFMLASHTSTPWSEAPRWPS